MAKGKVFFVGCGPGDPELITKKGYEIIKNADVIIYTGSLLNPEILKFAEKSEKIIDSFGKSVDEIVSIIEEYVNQGKTVVRLHDGDPSIFGSVKEQFELLDEKGIEYEVIPGVSSFLAMSAKLKTELTIPEVTQTVVITRYPGKTPVPENIKKIAEEKPTMIFFLSAQLLRKIVKDLMDVGYPPDFPCALCYKVTWKDEKILVGTLSDIIDKAEKEGIKMHALFIVSKAFLSKGKRSFVYSEKYTEIQKKIKKLKSEGNEISAGEEVKEKEKEEEKEKGEEREKGKEKESSEGKYTQSESEESKEKTKVKDNTEEKKEKEKREEKGEVGEKEEREKGRRKDEEKSESQDESEILRINVLRRIFKKIAFLAITLHGSKIVLKLAEKSEIGEKFLFIPEKFAHVLKEYATDDGRENEQREKGGEEEENIKSGEEKKEGGGGERKYNLILFKDTKETLHKIFREFDGMVVVMSLGALIRIISSLIQSKEKDPAVLCIDETGKFVISVLSGHVGGANELARYIAKLLNATPVITTASDSLGTIPVDIFGREWGWHQEADHDTFVKVSSAMVNFYPVAIVQESGEKKYKIPKNVEIVSKDEFLENQHRFSACLFITHRILDDEEREKIKIPTVFYRPKVLHVGIGFDKGVSAQDILEFLTETFRKNKISLYSIKRIVTIDKKKEDEEFKKFAEIVKDKFGAEHGFISTEELKKAESYIKNPSEFAEKYLGVPSVSEASAIVSAGDKAKLIVEKTKGKGKSGAGITLAVAIEEKE